jgi:hypothetical protein
LTLPAAEAYYGATRKPWVVVDSLHTDTYTRMAGRRQEKFVAVVMGTIGGLASPAGRLIKLVKK